MHQRDFLNYLTEVSWRRGSRLASVWEPDPQQEEQTPQQEDQTPQKEEQDLQYELPPPGGVTAH